MSTQVEPHEFYPIRWWDRTHDDGRCQRCIYPKWVHPRGYWTEARSLGDRKRYTLDQALIENRRRSHAD